MSTYLITGATGSLGSSVVKHLLTTVDTSEIAVLVRDTESKQAKEYKANGFDLRVADYDNLETLTEAFKEIKYLYFVSGSDINSRLKQHKNVIDAAVNAKVSHVIYTSAGRKDESENAPLFGVMNAHMQTERWLQDAAFKHTILQHNLYAEVVPMFIGDKKTLLQSKQIFLPAGNGKTAFALREDLAEAGAIVLKNTADHINKTYTLNGAETLSFEEIGKSISKITGENIGYTSPDPETFRTTMNSFGVPENIIGMMQAFSLGIAAGEFDNISTDLQMLLGREPKSITTLFEQVYS
ncbi:SDR family oxidoreductase [Leeuwenhoekiella sp. MAR_2009_132]|uniref:SDR family oxidoreductase n=1 Tax=Leeuwenhoekiella sp. MAR_2009_132 TaxID=1392489 RepID=UPI000491140F|nr:SDR family oxidoreductase [Leeuwenhoekiella sp. MAR_2009_132]